MHWQVDKAAQGIRMNLLSRYYLRGPVDWWYVCAVTPLTLKPQEIPFEHPDSCNMFRPGPDKPFVATRTAIALYQHDTIVQCLSILQEKAVEKQGIDYLQVFEDSSNDSSLWFIEDGPGGAITALLPSDY